MLRVTQAPLEEPVSIEHLKTLLRIDHDAMDDVLPLLISAAREAVERRTGYALASATYEWTPVGASIGNLPIEPGALESELGALPVVFKTSPGIAPPALQLAIVMLVGALLANPEATTDKVLSENPAIKALVFPFCRVLP